ncbi:NUDIX hydrolase [Sphingobium phenoxybenzoativorans]|uniref:NUDIX hydrolase n=1 Tax=Sphingobium phenoxybenzoativorans TaxID=1592790 RepID=UPI000871F1FB|nr:NUDIX hydrolase [Sphingobium phenoxybenzoativorans]
MNEPAPQERPAATTIIFRDRPGSAPELLFMERSSGMAFAAGALVFPGGAVDAEDFAFAASMDTALAVDEAAARIGAIRETLEESGLAIGFREAPDHGVAGKIREAMLAGEPFAALLAGAELALDLDRLVPFARWHPNVKEGAPRVFDTRFYLARWMEGSPEPTPDSTENVHLFWATAQDVLDRHIGGEVKIIFPTRRNLERLAPFQSFDQAVSHASRYPVEKVTPWIEDRDGRPSLCIPEGMGYPVTHEALETAFRG